ncbi:UDP-glycosyltransferase UGT5-like [Episyrphus balteatus]|uniref:UDP-glycosyltransferase UGT5-like n=1 Tax=Episyrphus balteatus TaxID=286459 RepID=UPI002485EF13|nr:UDP-glycosyltransferase UGT5-like [Episyrphus balteatus]
MKSIKLFWGTVLLFIAIIGGANTYKILGIFPSMLKSHFFIGSSLMKGLAEKGHQVTVISPFPQKKPLNNYHDVVTSKVLDIFKDRSNNTVNMRDNTFIDSIKEVYGLGMVITNSTLSEPSVQKLLASDEKFDAVICEVFVNDALFGIAEHFNAPLIGLSTFGAYLWNTELVGSPSPPSYIPSELLPFGQHMSLSERIQNLIYKSIEYYFYNFDFLPIQENLFNRYFPNSKLGLDKIRKNTALILLNSHVSLGQSRPYVPNMIEVGGIHINQSQKTELPDGIKKFLDDAKDGAIYFSMGSGMKSSSMSIEIREAILGTFKSLKQRVLWKFEDTNLPGKSENVMIKDWFPQQEVLAHPNVKIFITHGGLLSTFETIYVGKPIIGIPMFADQFMNTARSAAEGYGIALDYTKLNKKVFTEAINEMLNNPKYTKKAKEVSQLYRDKPLQPMELATYWVEFIAKHKGAPHLHNAGQDLSFIQYHNVDALSILIGGILLIVLLVIFVLYKLIKTLIGRKDSKVKEKAN